MELYDLLARVIEAFDGFRIPYLVTGCACAAGSPSALPLRGIGHQLDAETNLGDVKASVARLRMS